MASLGHNELLTNEVVVTLTTDLLIFLYDLNGVYGDHLLRIAWYI